MCDANKHNLTVLVHHIDSFGKNLSKWDIDFIADMIDDPPEEYSKNQKKQILRIYDQKC